MTISSFFNQFNMLSVYQQRETKDNYHECVVCNTGMDQWLDMLENVLGQAIKPFGVEPSPEHTQISNSFGGIFRNQILFHKKVGSDTVIAMVWPWQNNMYTTVKIARL